MKTPTIKELYGFHEPPTGEFGIEVEVELDSNASLSAVEEGCPPLWMVVEEGSVRHGTEFVLAKPLNKLAKDEALVTLYSYLQDFNVNWKTHRTSVHVHLNMVKNTITEVYNFITAYLLLEEVILNYCEDRRRGNLFCLSMKDAEYITHVLRDDIPAHNYLRHMEQGRLKYTAMNLASLPYRGSLEFRALEGSCGVRKVKGWSNALWKLKAESVKFNSPEEIVDLYFQSEPRDFIARFLPKYFIDRVCDGKDDRNWVEQIEGNLGSVATFAYCVDWKVWSQQMIEQHKQSSRHQNQPFSTFATAQQILAEGGTIPEWATTDALTVTAPHGLSSGD